MSTLISADLVSLDTDLGADADAVIAKLAARIVAAGRATDGDQLAADARAREAQSPTGLPGGLAIPHCRSAAVTEPTLAFARLHPRASFGAADGGADLVFMIAAPEGTDSEHLKLLSTLARALVRKDFTDALRAARTEQDVVDLVDEVLAPAEATVGAAAGGSHAATQTTPATPAAEGAAGSAGAQTAGSPVRIVAVTACPTGIAHTYMAADSLVAAGERAGVDLQVETQGSGGAKPLSDATISGADAVIFATDVGVKEAARFAGKPVIVSGVKRAINEPDTMVAEAVRAASDPSAKRVDGQAAAKADEESTGDGWGLKLRQYLLTGVSYMIPFVAAGGLLIALGFLLGGYELALNDKKIALDALANNSIFNPPAPTEHALFGSGFLTYIGALVFLLGGYAFGFLVPALAGYIAYAMADRPGIAPGFVMGFVALQVDGGFIGGIVGGLLAGAVAMQFARRGYPRWLQGLMPVVIIPLVTTLVVGLVMLIALAEPLRQLNDGLTNGLNSLNGSSAIVLGVVLGLMMCFDLGGPLNKAAYVFAITGLGTSGALDAGSSQSKIMAAVMISGMVPPLAMALSTLVRPRLYTPAEQENGKTAWLLGASFISEGAIPFAAADPLRVIPSMMLGGAVSGGLSMALTVGSKAPHGGIFVPFAIDNLWGFWVSIIAGTVVAALAVTLLKQTRRSREETTELVYTRVGAAA